MSSEIGDSSEGSRKEIQCKYKSISNRVGKFTSRDMMNEHKMCGTLDSAVQTELAFYWLFTFLYIYIFSFATPS